MLHVQDWTSLLNEQMESAESWPPLWGLDASKRWALRQTEFARNRHSFQPVRGCFFAVLLPGKMGWIQQRVQLHVFGLVAQHAHMDCSMHPALLSPGFFHRKGSPMSPPPGGFGEKPKKFQKVPKRIQKTMKSDRNSGSLIYFLRFFGGCYNNYYNILQYPLAIKRGNRESHIHRWCFPETSMYGGFPIPGRCIQLSSISPLWLIGVLNSVPNTHKTCYSKCKHMCIYIYREREKDMFSIDIHDVAEHFIYIYKCVNHQKCKNKNICI